MIRKATLCALFLLLYCSSVGNPSPINLGRFLKKPVNQTRSVGIHFNFHLNKDTGRVSKPNNQEARLLDKIFQVLNVPTRKPSYYDPEDHVIVHETKESTFKLYRNPELVRNKTGSSVQNKGITPIRNERFSEFDGELLAEEISANTRGNTDQLDSFITHTTKQPTFGIDDAFQSTYVSTPEAHEKEKIFPTIVPHTPKPTFEFDEVFRNPQVPHDATIFTDHSTKFSTSKFDDFFLGQGITSNGNRTVSFFLERTTNPDQDQPITTATNEPISKTDEELLPERISADTTENIDQFDTSITHTTKQPTFGIDDASQNKYISTTETQKKEKILSTVVLHTPQSNVEFDKVFRNPQVPHDVPTFSNHFTKSSTSKFDHFFPDQGITSNGNGAISFFIGNTTIPNKDQPITTATNEPISETDEEQLKEEISPDQKENIDHFDRSTTHTTKQLTLGVDGVSQNTYISTTETERKEEVFTPISHHTEQQSFKTDKVFRNPQITPFTTASNEHFTQFATIEFDKVFQDHEVTSSRTANNDQFHLTIPHQTKNPISNMREIFQGLTVISEIYTSKTTENTQFDLPSSNQTKSITDTDGILQKSDISTSKTNTEDEINQPNNFKTNQPIFEMSEIFRNPEAIVNRTLNDSQIGQFSEFDELFQEVKILPQKGSNSGQFDLYNQSILYFDDTLKNPDFSTNQSVNKGQTVQLITPHTNQPIVETDDTLRNPEITLNATAGNNNFDQPFVSQLDEDLQEPGSLTKKTTDTGYADLPNSPESNHPTFNIDDLFKELNVSSDKDQHEQSITQNTNETMFDIDVLFRNTKDFLNETKSDKQHNETFTFNIDRGSQTPELFMIKKTDSNQSNLSITHQTVSLSSNTDEIFQESDGSENNATNKEDIEQPFINPTKKTAFDVLFRNHEVFHNDTHTNDQPNQTVIFESDGVFREPKFFPSNTYSTDLSITDKSTDPTFDSHTTFRNSDVFTDITTSNKLLDIEATFPHTIQPLFESHEIFRNPDIVLKETTSNNQLRHSIATQTRQPITDLGGNTQTSQPTTDLDEINQEPQMPSDKANNDQLDHLVTTQRSQSTTDLGETNQEPKTSSYKTNNYQLDHSVVLKRDQSTTHLDEINQEPKIFLDNTNNDQLEHATTHQANKLTTGLDETNQEAKVSSDKTGNNDQSHLSTINLTHLPSTEIKTFQEVKVSEKETISSAALDEYSIYETSSDIPDEYTIDEASGDSLDKYGIDEESDDSFDKYITNEARSSGFVEYIFDAHSDALEEYIDEIRDTYDEYTEETSHSDFTFNNKFNESKSPTNNTTGNGLLIFNPTVESTVEFDYVSQESEVFTNKTINIDEFPENKTSSDVFDEHMNETSIKVLEEYINETISDALNEYITDGTNQSVFSSDGEIQETEIFAYKAMGNSLLNFNKTDQLTFQSDDVSRGSENFTKETVNIDKLGRSKTDSDAFDEYTMTKASGDAFDYEALDEYITDETNQSVFSPDKEFHEIKSSANKTTENSLEFFYRTNESTFEFEDMSQNPGTLTSKTVSIDKLHQNKRSSDAFDEYIITKSSSEDLDEYITDERNQSALSSDSKFHETETPANHATDGVLKHTSQPTFEFDYISQKPGILANKVDINNKLDNSTMDNFKRSTFGSDKIFQSNRISLNNTVNNDQFDKFISRESNPATAFQNADAFANMTANNDQLDQIINSEFNQSSSELDKELNESESSTSKLSDIDARGSSVIDETSEIIMSNKEFRKPVTSSNNKEANNDNFKESVNPLNSYSYSEIDKIYRNSEVSTKETYSNDQSVILSTSQPANVESQKQVTSTSIVASNKLHNQGILYPLCSRGNSQRKIIPCNSENRFFVCFDTTSEALTRCDETHYHTEVPLCFMNHPSGRFVVSCSNSPTNLCLCHQSKTMKLQFCKEPSAAVCLNARNGLQFCNVARSKRQEPAIPELAKEAYYASCEKCNLRMEMIVNDEVNEKPVIKIKSEPWDGDDEDDESQPSGGESVHEAVMLQTPSP